MPSPRKRAAPRAPAPEAPPPPQPVSFRPHLLIALALCLLTLLAYSNSFHDGYTLDCNQLLRVDKRIQEATAANVDLILHHTYWWPAGESGLYRPLATLSYMFNYAVLGNGERSAGYHWINFLLHLCNVLLLYALGLRLLGSRGRAAAVAALWAVHPVLTESVTNMVGRPDLLAGFGVLGGFLLYLAGVEATGRRRWAALGGAAAATAIGVFSKESAVTVLGVIAIFELAWWKERRQVRGRLAGFVAVAIPIAAMLFQRMQVMAAAGPASFPFVDNPLVNAGFIQGRLTAIAILARYVWRLACPITLSADYSYAQIPLASGTLADWVSWLVVAALAVLVFRSYRWNRTAFFFAGFAAVTILPTSNLLFPIGTIMAERFLYLPAVAFCACLVLCYGALPPKARIAAPWLLGLLVTAYAVRTWLRNPDWRDDLYMAQALVKTSPNSFKVRRMLAVNLFRTDPSHSRLDDVIAQAEKGVAILDPVPNADNNADSYSFAGSYYSAKGDLLSRPDGNGNPVPTPESVQAFRRAIELFDRAIAIMGWPGEDFRAPTAGLQPSAAVGKDYRSLTQIYLRLDNAPAAFNTAAQAAVADPLSPDTYLQLSRVLVRSNQPEAAAVALLEGSTLAPDRRLSTELVALFKGGLDPQSCALKPSPQGYGLDPGCASVRRLLCPALDKAIGVRLHTGRADLAQQLRDGELRQYGCPAAPQDPGWR
jgi:tetratricopeptide (TPR) repeat protein